MSVCETTSENSLGDFLTSNKSHVLQRKILCQTFLNPKQDKYYNLPELNSYPSSPFSP